MNNYNNNRGGDRRGGQRSDRRGSGRSNYGSRDSRQSEMHDAVCAECGNNCRIPFFPRSGKPVYCSDCFEKRGNDNNFNDRRSNDNYNDRRSNSPRGNDRPQVNYKEEFKAINAKLDQLVNLLSNKDVKKVTKKAKASKVSEETPKVEVTDETPKVKKAKVKTVAEIIAQAVETE
jgi:CxxC-x17-CxxC domain-containing protein